MIGLMIAMIISTLAKGQFVEFSPIQKQIFKQKEGSLGASSRINQTLSLPFWDDFSRGLDTTKWVFQGASYTATIGINPPSYGAILLDGVRADGSPYSLVAVTQGDTDTLTSKPIDISNLSLTDRESMYLSFFWQAGGRAELPDENDALQLQLKGANGNWITVWQQFGGVSLNREKFTQEIVKIPSIYGIADFQFRFVSEGRSSGPFDSWLIDYVFINSNRTDQDLTFNDRSLTQPNYLRIGNYGAYPFELFKSNQNGNWSTVENEFNNLEDRFRAMEYSISINDPITGNSTAINSNTPFNPVPNSLERRKFESKEFDEITTPAQGTILEIKTSLTSGDGLLFQINGADTTRYSVVDFRDNDTIRTEFPLLDYFAYDNGSADYSAGINQKSGQLAVRYSTPEEVYLKGISINFTNPKQANQAIDIVVWKDLDEEPIFQREDLIPIREASEELIYFSLDTNIRVTGDFYIGFTQFTNDFIYVGLDKVDDHGEQIFYNVVGEWVQNEEVKGSLMIRPHVSLAVPFEEKLVTSTSISIYPNPVQTFLNVEGDFSNIRIFDTFGREIFLEREQSNKGEIINFNGQRSGIYVLNAMTKEGIKSYRILVN
jgi:hypothetical protein